MKRFRNILFVADQADSLSRVFHRALDLAQANGARLTVMDTVERMVWNVENQAHFGTDLSTLLRDQRREELERLIAPYRSGGLQIETLVEIGTPFMEAILATLRNRYDLVIKSAEQAQGLRTHPFGPNDLHLLRKCPCPVWIDHERGMQPYRKLVAAVNPIGDDDEGLAKTILDLAFSLQAQEGTEVHIAHAWRLPGERALRLQQQAGPQRVSAMLAEQKNMHAQALAGLLQPYGLTLDDPNVHFEKGLAAPMISSLAEALPADLIITGTLGRSGIPGFFIGNTAEALIQTIDMPILAIKPAGFVSPITLQGV